MRKTLLVAAGVAMTLGAGLLVPTKADHDVAVDKSSVQLLGDLPALEKLTIKDGAEEAFKTPQLTIVKAIKAAKADKLDELKTCFDVNKHKSLDGKSYNKKGATVLAEIADFLKTLDPEAVEIIKQNTVGKYAVAKCKGDAGKGHLIRLKLTSPSPRSEKEKKPANWYLQDSSAYNFETNYNTAQLGEVKKAIDSGDVAALKKFVRVHEAKYYDLISGVQEGVDPMKLLMTRLQGIAKETGAPHMLLNGWSNDVALWFPGKGVLVLNFQTETDWQTKQKTTKVYINLESTASFHQDGAATFESFVNDYDW